MSNNSMRPPAGGSASPALAIAQPEPRGRALLLAVAIMVTSVLIGVAAGLIWAAVAPKVQYQVVTLSPPTAYATNPETSAFIAADGWYCFIALGGGALIGLLGYLIGVRRYGPVPMAAVVIGATGAAFIAEWIGHQASGGPGFDHVLATSKVGAYLHAPISLGAQGSLAFWPLAAAIVAGGIELVGVLRARHDQVYGGMSPASQVSAEPPRPGLSQPGFPAGSAGSGNGQPPLPARPGTGQPGNGQPETGGPETGQSVTGQPGHPGSDPEDGQPHFRPEQLEPGQYGLAGGPGQAEPGPRGWPDAQEDSSGRIGS